MRARTGNGLFVIAAVAAFASSFLFPGIRIAGVPVSLTSMIALAFVPFAPSAYDPPRWRTVAWAMGLLAMLTVVNAALYGLEVRNVLYLLIPLGALGAVAMMKLLVDRFGLLRVQRWAIWLCGINVAVMALQAFNILGINDALSSLWLAGIDFVATTDHEREILLLTLPIRPPGLFPTGIFASTALYIVCRGIFVYQGKSWPLLLVLISILLTANRTLGVIFVLYESIAIAHVMGFKRFFTRASVVVAISVLTVVAVSYMGVDLYLLKFLNEEVGGGDVESTASVVERLKTLDLFIENAPRHALAGGFSSSSLASAEHVFDSELMLRTLQFGVIGVLSLAFIILVPRTGKRTPAWNFLFVLAFLASLTTTLMTSVVYTMALAFYKECVVRAAHRGPLRQRNLGHARRRPQAEVPAPATSMASTS